MLLSIPQVKAESLDYVFMAPLTQSQEKTPINPEQYLPFLFDLLIGISALLAIVMIVVGGITYMTSDVFSQKSHGKETITNALWGLLLVISAYMILYTVNPDLLKFKLHFEPIDYPGWQAPVGVGIGDLPGRNPNYGTGPIGENDARSLLLVTGGNQITVNSPCSDGQANCRTQIGGVQAEVFQGITRIWDDCQLQNNGCPMVITGGSEPHGGNNDPHAAGYAVDIRSSAQIDAQMRNILRLGSSNPAPSTSGDGYTANLPGGPYRVYYEGDHWHLEKRR